MEELDTTTARRLREIAEVRHVTVEDLLAAHVPGFREESQEGDSRENKERAFESWAADFPANAPPLSNDAVSRGSIYHDR
jgi:hypothetical protein